MFQRQIMENSKLLAGKTVAEHVFRRIEHNLELFRTDGIAPGLVVILVGNDPASQVYVRKKGKTCEKLGLHSKTIFLDESTSEDELLNIIDELNHDASFNGILVQLPLPKQIDDNKIILSIDPAKDVDCFHPQNVGLLVSGNPYVLPCTPAGIVEILKFYEIETSGKHAVVLGRSNIVGKPMANLLIQKNKDANATVTVAHSRTKNIPELAREADILIAAIGQPEFVKADMVKEGAVVIDVGINRIDADTEKGYRLVGDVAFEEVARKASAITPVPGGVGPMTIAMLMQNTLKAAAKQHKITLQI
jgi:methylenetetrahydrofolate dehydrogenase (NADP+)/methenyltetrahydrofolate cyclohydrolase